MQFVTINYGSVTHVINLENQNQPENITQKHVNQNEFSSRFSNIYPKKKKAEENIDHFKNSKVIGKKKNGHW